MGSLGPTTLGAAALALTLLALAAPARAQGNYRSTPTGGRSALMGNTGVALARDGAAPFLNPATIVRIDDSTLAFSVNMYSVSLSNYSGWHQPGAVDQGRLGQLALTDTSETQARFDVLPSTLCLFFTIKGFGAVVGEDPNRDQALGRKGRQKLAACLGTTERDQASFPAVNFHALAPGATLSQGQSFSRSWSRFQVGPTWSVYATDELAFGASLHAIYSSYDLAWSSSTVAVDPTGHAIVSNLNSAADGRSMDLAAIVGMTYRVGRGTTFGLSAQTPALHVAGAYDANAFDAYSGAGDHSYFATGHGTFSATPPFRLSAGLGSEWPDLKLEVDASYYAPSSAALNSDLQATTIAVDGGMARTAVQNLALTEKALGILNSSAGFEYFFVPSLSLLGGFSTDFSTVPPLPAATAPNFGSFAQERMHRVAASAGIGSYSEATELLIGVQLGYGWGKALVANGFVLPNELAVVDKQSYSMVLVVAGNANLHAFESTLKRVEHLVTKGK